LSKKILVLLVMTVVMILGSATAALAYGRHNTLAWVDPNWGNSYNATTHTGIAEYTFQITAINTGFTGVTQVELKFDTNVFKAWEVVGSVPNDWTFVEIGGFAPPILTLSVGNAGTPIMNVGDQLRVQVAYELYDAPETLDWSEGGTSPNRPWSQGFATSENGCYPSGGSTEQVPEPTTALLFGSGIALIGYMRKKR